MNKLLVGGAAAALVLAVGPAAAQPAPPTPPGVASGTAPMTMPMPRAPHARMMVMSNRAMTRDEVASHVAKMFARLDANHDGFITKSEVEAMHQDMMAMHGNLEKHRDRAMAMPSRAASFDRLDTNHDGSLSRQEYLAARPQIREQRLIVMRDGDAPGGAAMPGMEQMKIRMRGMGMMGAGMHGMGGHLFDMADANHDGRVSLAEAQAAALAHFDRADTNRDGRITPDERRQLRQVRIERRTS
jgi:hypothetical protein